MCLKTKIISSLSCFFRNKKVQTSRLPHFLILENVTNTDVCHIANMKKDENIEFTLVNPEKKNIKTACFHIYGF